MCRNANSRSCHLALFQPLQLLELSVRAPVLARKLLCVLGYHAMFGQRECGLLQQQPWGPRGGEAREEMQGCHAQQASVHLPAVFAEGAPLGEARMGGDAQLRMLAENMRFVTVRRISTTRTLLCYFT